MSEDENKEVGAESTPAEETATPSRFPEMDELQKNIERRIRDNQKFLDHFMDKDFVDDDADDDDDDEEMFEEL